MRKYDIKNKRNIGIIIVISVIIIIMFSLIIRLFLRAEKEEYVLSSGTLVFDKDKTIIKVDNTGIIKTKWNNDYYLIYNDDNYELGDTAIAYNDVTGVIYLYGRYYEIGIGDEINITDNETVIKDSALTKFYKLADRKYLVIDKEITSLDGLLSTTDFLMVDLDKVGNATLTNHNVSLKTFSETVIVTSNYTFDVANEILTYGSDTIDLKKIIGSTNTYTKEDLIPEENTGGILGGDGVTNVTENPNANAGNNIGTGSGTGSGSGSGTGDGDGTGSDSGGGSGSGGNNSTIIEEIKKASKKTSIVSVTSGINKINVDYVVYDPYSEYTSVYLEVKKSGTEDNATEVIYLNTSSTSYTISNNILPNTKYDVVLVCTYIDLETGTEVKEKDKVSVTTKLPSISLTVPKAYYTKDKYGTIDYLITTDNSYDITSANLIVLVEGEEKINEIIDIDGMKKSILIPDIEYGDKVEFKLNNIKSNDLVINGLKAYYVFRY